MVDSTMHYAEQQNVTLIARLAAEQTRVHALEEEVHRLSAQHARESIECAEVQSLYDHLRNNLGNVATAFLNLERAWYASEQSANAQLCELFTDFGNAMHCHIQDRDYD